MILVLFLIFVISISGVSYADSSQRWWEKPAEGWFFFKEKPKEQKNEEEPIVEEKKPEEKPNEKKLFTDIMEETGKRLLSEAIENPTEENLKRYMQFNKLAYDISEDFAIRWQQVLYKNPDLLSERPVNPNLLPDYFQYTHNREAAILKQLSQKVGVFYFYSTTCDYCLRQNEFIKLFKKEHPYFVIKSISISDTTIPDLPDSVLDNGIAHYLNVRVVPSIYIVTPPDKFELLYAGLITNDDLKKALVYYATEVPINRSSYIENFNLNRPPF